MNFQFFFRLLSIEVDSFCIGIVFFPEFTFVIYVASRFTQTSVLIETRIGRRQYLSLFSYILGGWLSHCVFLNCVRSLIKVHKKVLFRLSFSIEKMEKNNNSNVLVVKACHRISFLICRTSTM